MTDQVESRDLAIIDAEFEAPHLSEEELLRKFNWYVDAMLNLARSLETMRRAHFELTNDPTAVATMALLDKRIDGDNSASKLLEMLMMSRRLSNRSTKDLEELKVKKDLAIMRIDAAEKDDTEDSPSPFKLALPHSHIEDYLLQCIVHDEGCSLTSLYVYDNYCKWCEDSGHDPVGLPIFSRQMRDQGVQVAKISGKIRYMGIRLAESTGDNR